MRNSKSIKLKGPVNEVSEENENIYREKSRVHANNSQVKKEGSSGIATGKKFIREKVKNVV